MKADDTYPSVAEPELVGTYAATAGAGGGYVWDSVLEYRVWCYPSEGAPDEEGGSDYFYAFGSCDEAIDFFKKTVGAQEPLALVVQEEFIDEDGQGSYVHVKERRVTEWPVAFLTRPRRTSNTIPDFMSPTAPPNRLDILRGVATKSD